MNTPDTSGVITGERPGDVAHRDLDHSKVPYAKPQPCMIADLVLPGVLQAALDPSGGDPRLWVPLSDTVSFRPIHFNVSQGFYTHVMRVTKGVCCRAIAVLAVSMRWCSRAAGITWSTTGWPRT